MPLRPSARWLLARELLFAIPVVSTVLVCCSPAFAQTPGTGFFDNFESSVVGTFPAGWFNSGNNNVATDNTIAPVSPSRCVRLSGNNFGCWEALIHRPLNTTAPFTMEVFVYTRSQAMTGCHSWRANVALFTGASWTTSGRYLAWFNSDLTITGSGGLLLGPYVPQTWYKVKVAYERLNASTVRLTYWINDVFVGRETLPAVSYESSLSYFTLSSGDGPAWFDDVRVSAGTPFGSTFSLLGIIPNKGGDTGSVTTVVHGNGFDPGSTVSLTGLGPDIPASVVTVNPERTVLTATFDLVGRARGVRDVVVSGGGASRELKKSFTVEEGRPAQLWTSIVGRGAVRVGMNEQVNLVFGNHSNIDVNNVVVWFAAPQAIAVTVKVPYLAQVGAPSDDPLVVRDGLVYQWFFADRIAAGETNTIPVSLNGKALGDFRIQAGIWEQTDMFPLLSNSPSQPIAALSSTPKPAALSAASAITVEPKQGEIVFKTSDPSDPMPQPGHVGIYVGDMPLQPDCVTCCRMRCVIDFVTDGGPWAPGHPRSYPIDQWSPYTGTYKGPARPSDMSDEQMKKFAEKTIQWFMDWVAQGRKEMSYTIPPGPWGEDCVSFVNDRLRDAGYTPSWSDWSSPGSLYEALTREVWPAFPSNVYRWAQRFTSLPLMPAPALYPYVIAQYRVVSSLDPNDKSGLPGTGTARFVTPSVTIPYVVQFENKKSATAPAQGVTITDQLDIAKLDLDTFSLGTISFGNRRVTPPAGVANYSTIVDLRPTDNLLVRIDASLDKTTGVLRWTFASLDPATNVPTSDSLAGFLPSGAEGSVLFTVNAKQGLTTGTEIRNQASIVFDVNPPIDTPVWLNTIDNTAPTSKVSPLPATQASANVAVRWTGSDIGSGVQDFTIYISDNGGPFAAWQSNTTATTATLAGTNGHTYRFYSVARDLVGNVEGAKSAAEAITTVVATVPGDVNSDGKVDCADIAIVQAAFGKKTGQPGWDARADVVPDGVIDVRDLSYVSQRLPAGTRCP